MWKEGEAKRLQEGTRWGQRTIPTEQSIAKGLALQIRPFRPPHTSDPAVTAATPAPQSSGPPSPQGWGQVAQGGANMLKGKAVNVPISGVGHLSSPWVFLVCLQ